MNFTRLEPELAELRARRLDARGPRLPHPRLLAEPPVLRLVERFDIEPFPDFLAKMSKLYRARSLLYRRQILQENIRWKALDEIYNIYMLLHRSDLNNSAKLLQTFSHFRQKMLNAIFKHCSSNFAQMLMNFSRNFTE